ncbi:RelA/SpoT domain-containing protein [Shewanella algidipiscicola]|uniref:GTP pyrophosphokinase n=1 Tax=Shewanella algidipiscicola TaxID=614070 RepID=A0ABQ4PMH4_9GAMM|nr:RelA/SpoT domain-containing protein [Shewanella algidipiscicola]GIU49454.1 GTP pyrophosphokinase [Shewanella algidipiscicola]
MNRLFRTFIIFLLLLSTRSGLAASYEPQVNLKDPRSNFISRQSFHPNLAGLIAIPTTSSQPIRQTSSNLEQLYAKAEGAQQELRDILKSLDGAEHYELMVPAVKSYQRAAQKVVVKFNGDASQITDLARASIVASDIHRLMHAFEALQHKATIVQVKNRFATPKASGYRDLNLLVQLPQSGMIAEVQLHLKAIAEIKSGEEHQIYQAVQTIEANAKQQQRALTQLELAKITQLRQQSHKCYHKAWLHYKRIDSAHLIAQAA